MLVVPDAWELILKTQKDGSEKTVTLQKFVEVTVPRNSYSVKAVDNLMAVRERLKNGEEVDGAEINLKGVTFRRAP